MDSGCHGEAAAALAAEHGMTLQVVGPARSQEGLRTPAPALGGRNAPSPGLHGVGVWRVMTNAWGTDAGRGYTSSLLPCSCSPASLAATHGRASKIAGHRLGLPPLGG